MLERCWFERAALAELYAQASRRLVLETGGALLGWRDETDAVVARVLGPGQRAKHGFSYFEPDGEWQVSRGREIYIASERTIAYLGDWHTHPRSHPRPSPQDRSTANQIASDPDFRAPEPLYAIIGRPLRALLRRSSWRLVMYVFAAGCLQPVEIVIYNAPRPLEKDVVV